eukprot:COSAG01_NODE_3091_length_6600_cov_17.518074_3_plen_773_part_00
MHAFLSFPFLKFGESTGLIEHVVILLELFQILRSFSDSFLLPLPGLMSTYHQITQIPAAVTSLSPRQTVFILRCWLGFSEIDVHEFYAAWFFNVFAIPLILCGTITVFHAAKCCCWRRNFCLSRTIPRQGVDLAPEPEDFSNNLDRLTNTGLMDLKIMQDAIMTEKKRVQGVKNNLVFVALLLYPSVSEELFQLFSIRKLGPSESWLEDDYETPAQDKTWWIVAIIAVGLIMLISIGFPLWLWCEIYTVRCVHAAEWAMNAEFRQNKRNLLVQFLRSNQKAGLSADQFKWVHDMLKDAKNGKEPWTTKCPDDASAAKRLNHEIFHLQFTDIKQLKRRNSIRFAWAMLRPGGLMTYYGTQTQHKRDAAFMVKIVNWVTMLAKSVFNIEGGLFENLRLLELTGEGAADTRPALSSNHWVDKVLEKLSRTDQSIAARQQLGPELEPEPELELELEIPRRPSIFRDAGMLEVAVESLESRLSTKEALEELKSTYEDRFAGKGRLEDIAREFKPSHLQAEPVAWFRRMIQCGAIVWLKRGSVLQMVVGICLTSYFAMRHFAAQPFEKVHTNMFKSCAEAQLFLTYLIGLILRLHSQLDDDDKFDLHFFGDLLIVSFVILVPVSFVVCTYWNIEATDQFREHAQTFLRIVLVLMSVTSFSFGCSWYTYRNSLLAWVAAILLSATLMLGLTARSHKGARGQGEGSYNSDLSIDGAEMQDVNTGLLEPRAEPMQSRGSTSRFSVASPSAVNSERRPSSSSDTRQSGFTVPVGHHAHGGSE